MDLVVDAEKGHNFFKVFFVLVSSSTIPNAWSVDKVELGNVCLKHILPRGLGSRPTGGENFICIRTKANFRPFPFLIRIGKPGINRPFHCQNNAYFDLMYYDVSLQAVLMTEVWIFHDMNSCQTVFGTVVPQGFSGTSSSLDIREWRKRHVDKCSLNKQPPQFERNLTQVSNRLHK